MIKKDIEKCPFCGNHSYYHQIKTITLNYKSHPIKLNQPGFWCDSCKEGVIGGVDRKITQKKLQAFRAKIDGLLTPERIKRVREKLHLSQHKAAHIFGGGINAFSRYERGETPIPRALSHLLFLLEIHPNLLRELDKRYKISKRKAANG